MYKATAIAILSLSLLLIIMMVNIRPNVATISEINVEKLYRSFVDHSNISLSK